MSNISAYPPRERTRGRALARFALVMPVWLILLMAVIEVARLFSAWVIVESSAREAVLYAVSGDFAQKHCTAACASFDPATRQAAQDQARLLTIKDIAAAAQSDLLPDMSAPRAQRSFVSVTVCSNRPGAGGQTQYAYREDIIAPSPIIYPRCVLAANPDVLQEDPGGQGGRVIITVLFDYPLITPLRAVVDWIPLVARRELIVQR